MDTMALKSDEIKEHLKRKVSEEGHNLSSPENRFTLWSENGTQGFLYEGSAEYDHQIAFKLGGVTLKNKTRTAILDSRDDRLLLFGCEIG